MFLGGMISVFLNDNDMYKNNRGLFYSFLPLCLFLFFIVAFRCIYLKNKSSRSGSESFGFRSLSSHTTVRAVRHTAVWFAFKGVFAGYLPSFLISAAD